jgi:small subunit ribosomal protein S6
MRSSPERSATISRFIANPAPNVGAPAARQRVHREVMLAVARVYELMIIFDGELEDAVVQRQIAALSRQIDLWGKRRFAYEIDHKWEGIYVVFEIVTEATDLHDLERNLRIADEVVRHKVIRLPDAEAERRGLVGEAAPAEAG